MPSYLLPRTEASITMAANVTAAGIVVTIPPNVAQKTGPRIIGFLFHWGLFGALCVQVYLYHLAFPRDPRRNKLLVYSVFALEFAQTMMITKSAFTVFGDGYGQFGEFNKVGPSWFEVPFITGIVAFIAEVFYAYRISVLAQSYWVASVIFLLATVQLGGAFAAGIILKRAGLFSNLLGRSYSISAGIWNGGSAACDIIIAVCMTYYLSRRGSGTMKETNVLLKRVITLVIETGTITAAVALLDLILVVLPSKPSYYLTPSETLAKFYSNSMMVVLNSRMRIGVENNEGSTYAGTRIRTGTTAVVSQAHGTDAYELGDGVVVTREQLVFPSGDEMSKANNSKGYLV